MEASDVWFILSLLGILLLTSPSLGQSEWLKTYAIIA
jgi:hypothetical protein